MATKNIIVYGGSYSGVAAACKAAGYYEKKNDKDYNITLIVPDVSEMLGGLGTAGGQNYFDMRRSHNNTYLVHGGSFGWWYDQMGQFYSVEKMSNLLKSDVDKYSSNINVMYKYDVREVTMRNKGKQIYSITVQGIKRSSNGYIVWDESTAQQTIRAHIYIDASDDGRLTWMSDFKGTVGRYDWPEEKLGEEEVCTGVAYQQAATLMVKVKGLNYNTLRSGMNVDKDIQNNTVIMGCDGGSPQYKDRRSTIYEFNHKRGSEICEDKAVLAFKPVNAARNGKDSDEWWLNALLIFNVDGRAHARDKGTKYYPADMIEGALNVDEAWVYGRYAVGTREFRDALRALPGFENADVVYGADNKPVVGDLVYLRETIHNTLTPSNGANGQENANYALLCNHAIDAGESSTDGADAVNYKKRIGLGFYPADINAYERSDLQNKNGDYIWFHEVSRKLRPEIFTDEKTINEKGGDITLPLNPVYLPADILFSPTVVNLLVSGVACSSSSMAWSEIRVLPNLCVLGDAAGITAAYIIDGDSAGLPMKDSDIENIQDSLRSAGAILEK